jgi:hypothetical protein
MRTRAFLEISRITVAVVAVLLMASVAQASQSSDIRDYGYFLLRLKYAPSSITDQEWTQLAQKQARADWGVYSRIDDLEEKLEKYPGSTTPNQMTKQLDKAKLELSAVVFKREEVMGRDPQFVANQFLPQFKQRITRIADSMPERLTISYEYDTRAYKYDFDNQFLYHTNTWLPCDLAVAHGCLPNGQGSHFFALVPRKDRLDRIPELKPFFVAMPQDRRINYPSPDPNGLPSTLWTQRGHLNRAMIAIDRIIGMPYLKLDAARAEALVTLARDPKPGSCLVTSGRCNLVSEMQFTVSRMEVKERDTAVIYVKLLALNIFAPDRSLLASFSPEDFKSSDQLAAEMHAANAAKEAELAAAEEAREQAAAEETARLTDLDVVGLKIGMKLTDAEKLLQERMQPTSVYRFSHRPDRQPFEQAYVYFRLEGSVEDTPVPDFCQQDFHPSMKEKMEQQCRMMREGEYWGKAIPKEVVTLTVEKAPDGVDTVMGILRWVSLPADSDKAAVQTSLEKKYGAVSFTRSIVKRDEFSLFWGAGSVNKTECQPQSKHRVFRQLGDAPPPQLVRGDAIHENARFFGVVPTSLNGSLLQSYRNYKKKEDSPFGACGVTMNEQFEPEMIGEVSIKALLVNLADFNQYFDVFQQTSPASESGSKQIDLEL